MNVYMVPTCAPLHLGCYYDNGNLQFLELLTDIASPEECQQACADYPTCILTQYGEGTYCNLFASDFANTYDPGSEITYAGYCNLFAFYTFATCPVSSPPPS